MPPGARGAASADRRHVSRASAERAVHRRSALQQVMACRPGYGTISGMPTLSIAQDPAADELLGRDPLALMVGMLLDQQFPMERAFGAPRLLADRLGVTELSAGHLATMDPEALTSVFRGPPALHRYPGSMAGRAQELCRLLVERHDGRAENLWADAPDGATLLERLNELP